MRGSSLGQRALLLGIACRESVLLRPRDITACKPGPQALTLRQQSIAAAHQGLSSGTHEEQAAAGRGKSRAGQHQGKQSVQQSLKASRRPPRERLESGKQQRAFIPMSDDFLAEIASVLQQSEEHTSSAKAGSSEIAMSSIAEGPVPASSADAQSRVPAGRAQQSRHTSNSPSADVQQESSTTVSRSAPAGGSARRQARSGNAEGLASSGMTAAGQPHEKQILVENSQQDSLDWNNRGVGRGGAGGSGPSADGSRAQGDQVWEHSRDAQPAARQDGAVRFRGRLGGSGFRGGRDGSIAHRPPKLTHRERVNMCLESNRCITATSAAAQVELYVISRGIIAIFSATCWLPFKQMHLYRIICTFLTALLCNFAQDALMVEVTSQSQQQGILLEFVAQLEGIVDNGAYHFDPVNICTALQCLRSMVGSASVSPEVLTGMAMLVMRDHRQLSKACLPAACTRWSCNVNLPESKWHLYNGKSVDCQVCPTDHLPSTW